MIAAHDGIPPGQERLDAVLDGLERQAMARKAEFVAIMADHGMSQAEAARAIKVHPATLSSLLRDPQAAPNEVQVALLRGYAERRKAIWDEEVAAGFQGSLDEFRERLRKWSRRTLLKEAAEIRKQEIEALAEQVYREELERLRTMIREDVRSRPSDPSFVRGRGAAQRRAQQEAFSALIREIVATYADTWDGNAPEVHKAAMDAAKAWIRMWKSGGAVEAVDAYAAALARLHEAAAHVDPL
jgi:uncharacterized protein (DUF2267 family)